MTVTLVPVTAPGTPAVPAVPTRRRRVVVVVALVAALLAGGATVAAWALVGPPGAVGHDVSYPQCGQGVPTTGSFGVVGVNGGKVSTANPCLASQYGWASGRSNGASLYANTGNPGSISTFYWPASGSRDPALCTDRTSAADAGCAYDYGYHGGQDSLRIAKNALGSGVTGRTWWLDVEVANSWNGTASANAASLQGAVDALVAGGVGTVGIYSTAYQWTQITGGYSGSTAASYRAGWASAFTPKRPLESAPLWVAGLSSVDAAAKNCGTSFTGGTTALAQYTDGAFDGDLVCGGGTPPTTGGGTTTTAAPTTSTVPTTTAAPGTTTAASGTTTAAPSTTTAAPTTTTSARPTTTTPTSTTAATPTSPTTATSLTPTSVVPTSVPPVALPGAPTAVVATPDPTRGVALRWTAPVPTAKPVNRYVILRGSIPGREVPLGILTCRTATCAWRDTTVARGARAYYQVIAVDDANALGPRSPEVSAVAR
jgi:hypothetical protein